MSTIDSIKLSKITPENIESLKKLHQIIFPVSYDNKYYKKVLEVGEYAKIAYFNDILVGVIVCQPDIENRKLYISTIGCLAPYRRLGIGSKMLMHVLECAKNDGNYDTISLHVQTINDIAIKFYRHFGFQIKTTVEYYFPRLQPPHAFILEKSLK